MAGELDTVKVSWFFSYVGRNESCGPDGIHPSILSSWLETRTKNEAYGLNWKKHSEKRMSERTSSS